MVMQTINKQAEKLSLITRIVFCLFLVTTYATTTMKMISLNQTDHFARYGQPATK